MHVPSAAKCVITLGVILVTVGCGPSIDRTPADTSSTKVLPASRTLIVAAHDDDNLLFMLPDEFADVTRGHAVQAIYLTAGDAGLGPAFWHRREQGAMAGTAALAHVADKWAQDTEVVDDHAVTVETLTPDPAVSIVFLRLPDGNTNGLGWSRDHYQSLEKLWTGQIASITSLDGANTYTKANLISLIGVIMNRFRPGTIRTQNFEGKYGNGDHPDHLAAAYFVKAANTLYRTVTHRLIAYQGYPDENLPPNVSGSQLTAKTHVFLAYSKFNDRGCDSTIACNHSFYRILLPRQYVVTSIRFP